MNKKLLLLALTVTFFAPSVSHADIPQVQRYVANATEKGTARLKYLMWNVYDATLYTPQGQYKEDGPFALKLDYLINLKGDDIAVRSIKEIRAQGFDDETKLLKWEENMKNIFPDIESGESIIGIRDDNKNTVFYKNDTKIGQINDPDFTKVFFDIWLSPQTSQPSMRQQLLGLK